MRGVRGQESGARIVLRLLISYLSLDPLLASHVYAAAACGCSAIGSGETRRAIRPPMAAMNGVIEMPRLPSAMMIARPINRRRVVPAMNNLSGSILDVEVTGPLVRLTADVGARLVAMITRQSLAALKLEIGSKAFFSVKASAIHIFW